MSPTHNFYTHRRQSYSEIWCEIFEGLAKAKSKKYRIKDCCKFAFPTGFVCCALCVVTSF